MKKYLHKALPLFLALMILIGLPAQTLAATKSEIESATEKSLEFMLGAVKSPQVGSIGGEWAVIALARGSYDVPQEYWNSYYATVAEYVKTCGGVLHDTSRPFNAFYSHSQIC